MDPRETTRGLASPDRLGELVLRWLTYNAVGLMGMAVQLGALIALTELWGLDVFLATALAVEAAILHNFAWHERWTWGDRLSHQGGGRWRRLVRFNLVTGTVSVVGTVLFTGLYTTHLGLHYVVVNVMATASVSIVNFVANDRLVFHQKERTHMRPSVSRAPARRLSSIAAGVFLFATTSQAAELQRQTVDAWSAYVQLTEQRIEEELRSNTAALGRRAGALLRRSQSWPMSGHRASASERTSPDD